MWIEVHVEDEQIIQSGCTALRARGFVNLVFWRLGFSLGFCCCCCLFSALLLFQDPLVLLCFAQ